jgi:MYXO-CTERM domain-containing protein
MRRSACRTSACALAISLAAATARAEPGAGTLDDPTVVDALPYIVKGSTVMGPSDAIDSYSCDPALDESGPEHIYRFNLEAPARVTAWVEGDGGSVDIDVHLLDGPEVIGGVATQCATRANVIAEAEMSAGEHWVVVDSYAGDAQAGSYVLHLEAIGDAWIERPIANGVRWRARRFADVGGPQVVHLLSVDTLRPDVDVRAIGANGCQTVGAVGEAAGAIAGINGGFFGPNCAPVTLLKESGTLVATNGGARGSFGLTQELAPMVQIVGGGQDWPEAYEAHGGGPVLVVGAAAYQGSADWADQGYTSASFNGKNPRTFAGFDSAGVSLFATVDGRRSNATGMSLDELAAFAANADLALTEAVNLDGGGSTTMWIAGMTPNGVVNYPSDAAQEQATHPGSRPNSGGFFVFAPPYNHPPRFQTEPLTTAAAGTPYLYDVDAIDLDVDDVVSYALLDAPDGMIIDADSGVVSFDPTVDSPPSAEVVVEASDDRGAASEQAFTLLIAGGMGTGGEGGGSGAGGAGQGDDPGVPSDEASGCGCRTASSPASDAALLLLLVAAALRRRTRR